MKFKLRRKHARNRAEKGTDAETRKARRRFRLRRPRRVTIPSIPLRTMAPNLVTMSAAACGIVAIILAQRAYEGKCDWSAPLIALFVSAVCDFCDGGVARLLNATSKIGAELDSLADFLNFGVAPALITFYWMLPHLRELPKALTFPPQVLIALVLFYAMSCAFRLARFNTLLAEPTVPRWSRYFMGVPAPGGAFLLLTPLLLWVGFGETVDFLRSPYLGAFLLLLVGALMVSRVPTFALKHFHASKRFMAVFAIAFIAASVFVGFCETVGIIGLLYFATLPVFAVKGMRLSDEADEIPPDGEPAASTQQPGAE